jgi:predicted kinase
MPQTSSVAVEDQLAAYRFPVLVVMSGLPGTGKSYVSRKLARSLQAVVVESDRVRKALFPRPNYGPTESVITHGACRRLIGAILFGGRCAIYDATNLIEFQRRTIYALARVCCARLFIVQTTAPQEEVLRRLEQRKRQPDGSSDADWEVYQRLAVSQEPIARNHLSLDTTEDVSDALHQLEQLIRRAGTTADWSQPKTEGEIGGNKGLPR